MRVGHHTLDDLYVLRSLIPRISCRTERTDGECAVWVGPVDRSGYPKISALTADGERISVRPYRVLACLFSSECVAGRDVDHLCNNRRCLNPKHLEVVSKAENIKRMHYRLRHSQQIPLPWGHEACCPAPVVLRFSD